MPFSIAKATPHRALLLAVAGGTFIGLMSPNLAPFQIGMFIDHLGFSEEKVGFLVTIELFVLSIAALMSPLGFKVMSYSRFAYLGLVIALIGQTTTIFVEDYSILLACRVVSAFGLGMIYGAANAAGAKSEQPERLFSIAIACTLLVYAVFLPAMAMLANSGGPELMYAIVVLVMIVSGPLLRGLDIGDLEKASVELAQSIPWKKFLNLILVLIFYNLGTGAAWTFAERAGVELGLEAETIATVVGSSTLAGIFGSLAVAWVGGKFGRTLPLLFGLSLGGVACFFLASGISVTLYAISCWLYWLSYMFMYPFLVGIAASLDKAGRCSATAAGVLMLSFSLGPMLGAGLISSYSYEVLAWFGLGSCVFAAILMVPLSLSLDREDKRALMSSGA